MQMVESGVVPKRRPLDRHRFFPWKGAFENWARKWVSTNFWRVRHYFPSEEDALQQCAMLHAYCIEKYAHKVDNAAWMMALFKLAVQTEWHTYARKDQRLRDTTCLIDPEAYDYLLEQQTDYSSGPLAAAFAKGSEELKQVILILLAAPSEMVDMIFPAALRRTAADHERINRRLRRLCRIKTEVDVLSELRALLS